MSEKRLERLVAVSGLLRDHELGQLKAAVALRDAAAALRDGLSVKAGGDATLWKAQIDYARWIEQRRAVLEVQIAGHDERIAAQMVKARLAFARADVLEKLWRQLS